MISLDPGLITRTSTPPDYTRRLLDKRKWRITVAGAELPPNVDCAFEIKKSRRASHLNSCKLDIYNLSKSTREFLEGLSLDVKPGTKGTGKGSFKQVGLQSGDIRVEIEAGYEGTDTSLIFRGDLRTCRSERQRTDIVTTIWGEDGGRSSLEARVTASFPPGTTYESVARFCAARMGVGVGNLGAVFSGGLPGLTLPSTLVYFEGTSVSGSAGDQLRGILRGLGVSYTIQDGAIQCLAAGGWIPSTTVLLSPTTGLIGSPEKDANGYVIAKCLIQPGLFVGGRVRFATEDFDGDHVVHGVEYDGETFGSSWFVKIETKAPKT